MDEREPDQILQAMNSRKPSTLDDRINEYVDMLLRIHGRAIWESLKPMMKKP